MEQNQSTEVVPEEKVVPEKVQQKEEVPAECELSNEGANVENSTSSSVFSRGEETSQLENEEDNRQGTKRPGEDSEEESKRVCLTENTPAEIPYIPTPIPNNEHFNHDSKELEPTSNLPSYSNHAFPQSYQPPAFIGPEEAPYQPPYQPYYEHLQHYEPQLPNIPNAPDPATSASTHHEEANTDPEVAATASPTDPSKESPEVVNIHEKLREMEEISVKPVSKSADAGVATSKPKENESEVSVEIKKKTAELDAETKRITNLRKNIREVMDENQLDATTLAAQRQESERLARVQVQQKIIRELQRQMAVERHNNRTQNRVLSLLQGQTSILRGSSATGERSTSSQPAQSSHSHASASDMYIVKGVASEVTFKGSNFVDVEKFPPGNLTPSVSIAPVRRIKSMIDSDMSEEESESEESEKKDVVEIVDSSSDDDCIVLSDDEEEEEEPEDDPDNSGLHVKDAYNIPDEQGRVLINIGHPENEEDIFLAPQIARIIKPHQIGGVRFLYDNIIESTERFSSSTGFGCILAHSMGLGKTLQVVCFCDIFLRHTNSKSILCILPINTLQNWMAEFNMWLPEDPEKSPLKVHGEVRPRNFKIFVLNDQQKTLSARSKIILEWAKVGGVLLIGYELFRLLSLKLANKKKKGKKVNLEKEKADTEAHKRTMEDIHAALVRPGPDLVICDEGHRIKNSHASISVALKQIRSKRRIVLTGYPLQNNLLEYWCMVDFVRPNYLGTKTEFANMFERPIQNGQCIDSTPQDIKLMRYRAHVLHSLLVGFVQRRSHVVLTNSLPQKEEYVILVKMTNFQRKLYNTFMNEVVRTKAVPNPLKAFAVCCKIWNHPDVLYNFLKKRETDLDLELEEVEADTKTTTTTPATSNRGRKKGSTNKTTKGVNKNGKTIPAVEVQPNQAKLSSQPVSPTSEDISIKSEMPDGNSTDTTDAIQVPTTVASDPSESMPPPSAIPPLGSSFTMEENTDQSLPTSVVQLQQPKQEYNADEIPQPVENNASNTTDYSSNPSPNFASQQSPAQNQPYANNYNPYNPYEYDPYYAHQYGSMYPPPAQQYPGNSYDQPYMSNSSNNYWPNNYYGYNNVGNPMNADPYGQGDPSYAGLVPKATESFDSSKPPSAEEKSSEIVDLDTKEIKTVEATIVVEDVKESVEEQKIKVEKDTDEKEVKGTKESIEIKQEISVKDETKEKDDSSEECIALTPEKEKDLPRASAKDDGIPYDWAVELMKGYVPDLLENSPKMEIFFRLLEESVSLGDRILVFSQSLLTLNLVERFLQRNLVPGCDYNWAKNTTYFRLDGSTSAMEREKLINEFNANPHIHLFLVSTRAGSLGINLVGANRVVVFDASWNPCHDTQAVCRVYRYGQKKPCFVYRIVMDNCLEKKIYDRQINKQGMSDRVVDECNPDAHLSMKEVTNLCYDNDEEEEMKDLTECKDKYLDIIMQKILELHSELLSKEPFHHESLLVDRKEKKLSQAEKRLAQRGYEMEKRAAAKPAYVYHSMGTQYRIMKTSDGSIVHRPVASVRPMQAEGGDKIHGNRPGGVRPTRWIPAEVWQRQGMTAQEMTLPLDVVIPTSSGDKSNIVLKAGQKVMVLKSPKGIYMQLETGKIIAIRTSVKMGQNQNKEKIDDGDAGSSNLGASDDLLGKPTIKSDQPPSSPVHQPANNAGTFNMNNNAMTGKQSSYPVDANRGGKTNEQSAPGTPFKANNIIQNRNFAQTPNTNNSKNFNVQSLIDGKVSTGQQNASIYSHTKGADMMLPESHRNMNSPGGPLNKTNLYNAATKANYPRSNYSFTNALKQAQTHGNQQSYANVKPQIHENKMWEQNKSQSSKNVESSLPTITIDDDIDPPLREKVVYKPNLVERKSKHASHRNTMQSPTASMGMAGYGKQMLNKNPHAQMQAANSGNFKGSESLRQLHNVKPYNRQYPDHRGTPGATKLIEDSMQTQSMQNAGSPQDMKSSPGRSKMPSIRNIPAPFPSACMGTSQAATQSNMHNPPTYTQSNMSASSQDNGSKSTTHSISSYSSDQNTQHNQDNSDYQVKGRSSSQQKPGNESSKSSDGLNLSKSNTLGNEKSRPPSPNQQSQQSATPVSASSISHTNSDAQYSGYNEQQPTPNPYPSNPNDSAYSNYNRSDIAPYQTPYADMYASGAPNPYGYPPTGQHHPPPQSGYPYGSYYDHQMYGSSSTPSYGTSASAPPGVPPHQQGQYHYPNYQPPSAVPPQSSDPYSSYYNYPPYPPQAGNWQP